MYLFNQEELKCSDNIKLSYFLSKHKKYKLLWTYQFINNNYELKKYIIKERKLSGVTIYLLVSNSFKLNGIFSLILFIYLNDKH